MQSISFPDINPAKEFPPDARISMAAGDFLQVCVYSMKKC